MRIVQRDAVAEAGARPGKPILAPALFAVILLLGASPAQTVTKIHDFNGTNGGDPQSVVLTQGRDGRLYGTTGFGGAYAGGGIFKQRTAGTGLDVLYNFNRTTEGYDSAGGLTLASDGNFYSALSSGGPTGFGVLYKVTSAGVLTTLHQFQGGADGGYPIGPPIEATDGNLYGVTIGGTGADATVYKYTTTGTFSNVYVFPDSDDSPTAPPLQAADGNLYFPSSRGGTSINCGAIFELSTSGVLLNTFSFDCLTLGQNPGGPLIQISDGTIYGTTPLGGTYNDGTIYTLDTTTGILAVAYDFGTSPTDGRSPEAGFTLATDGNFYSSTMDGGIFGSGSLFQLSQNDNYAQLYSFPVAGHGQGTEAPLSAPVQATTGLFYGVTDTGGFWGEGTIYTLDMGLGPFIAFVRAQGHVGATAQILGQGFTGATRVTFNGVPAVSYAVVSDTYLTAVVPSGATSGPVVVTTPTGALNSNRNFTVSQ